MASYIQPVNLEELLGDLTLAKLDEVFQSVLRRCADKIDPVRSGFGEIEMKRSAWRNGSWMWRRL